MTYFGGTTMADIDALKKAYDDYKNDYMLNNIGKLNLVAFIGERSGVLFDEIERLRAENEALRYELTKLQWQPTRPGPNRQYCCPVCGGSKEYSGHDTACELAALIDPHKAETYKEMTGGDIIKTLLFCKANGNGF
jgi:uncharacterized small protein (DUF1192 family)